MEYKLIRSKRKTLVIKIIDNCQIIVLAPNKCSLKNINDFVVANQNWIAKKIQQKQAENQLLAKYYNFDNILLFGESLDVVDKTNHYQIGEHYVKHSKSSNKQKVIKEFLKKQANVYIISRAKQIAQNFGFEYKDIQITSAKRSWGSCNSLKCLKFNYKTIMLPKQLIDYVICHELCHLKEMNHGVKFWKMLGDMGYKKTEVNKAFKPYNFVLQLF